jgi:hypothetical protein
MKKASVDYPHFSRFGVPDQSPAEEKRRKEAIAQLSELIDDERKLQLVELYDAPSFRQLAVFYLEDSGWDVGKAFLALTGGEEEEEEEPPPPKRLPVLQGPSAFNFTQILVQCPIAAPEDCGVLVVLEYLRRFVEFMPGALQRERLTYGELSAELQGMRKNKLSVQMVLKALRRYFPDRNCVVFVRSTDPVTDAGKLTVLQSFPGFGKEAGALNVPLSVDLFIYFEEQGDGGTFSLLSVGVYERLPPIRTILEAQSYLGQLTAALSSFIKAGNEPEVKEILKYKDQDLSSRIPIAGMTWKYNTQRDESPKRKATPKVVQPVYVPPPAPVKAPPEEEEEDEEEEEEALEEAEEDESVAVDELTDFFTEEGLIDALEEEAVDMTKKYFFLWQAMKKPDITWEHHLYDLYLEKAHKSIPKTLMLMRTELKREEDSHKPGHPKYWRLDQPLPAKPRLNSVCVVCLEAECAGKHKL